MNRDDRGRLTVRGAGQRHRGLTPKEQAIMDRWDAGKTIRQIAAELDKPVEKVRNLVIWYDGAAEHRLHCKATKASSAALLQALQEARP